MLTSKIKKFIIGTALCTTLAGCGGGGGVTGLISDTFETFVGDTVSQLADSEVLVNLYNGYINTFEGELDGGSFSISSLINGPNSEEISDANKYYAMVLEAETTWARTLTKIDNQSDEVKRKIYASDSYKDAHASFLYLQNHVKPILVKVKNGKRISLTEYNKVTKTTKAKEIMEQEKTNTVVPYANDKLTKLAPVGETEEEKAIRLAELEEKLRLEAEEKAIRLAKEKADLEEKLRLEAEEKLRLEAEEKLRLEEIAKKQAEEAAYKKANESNFKTSEYDKMSSLDSINASKAYDKGYTGEGAVLGVIDTYQQTDHAELKDKYLWYNNYVRYGDGETIKVLNEQYISTNCLDIKATIVNGVETTSYDTAKNICTNSTDKAANNYYDSSKPEGVIITVLADTVNGDPDGNGRIGGNSVSHGTQVAGIIAGNKDDSGMHGVAFDSKLVGANVDYTGNGEISFTYMQHALHDMAKLKNEPNGENLNIIAVNISSNRADFLKTTTVTELADGTYNASKITDKINHKDGQAKYFKVATDNDIILVNSAGNDEFAFSSEPGIWATQVYTQFHADHNLITEGKSVGDLILDGKMVIVGNWDTVGKIVQGNKAGHVCLDINTSNNTCNDEYKVSDFYILAPGQHIYSSVADNGYLEDQGTSFAAPHVTGAFGILHQMWPHMKGENLVQLVLTTANKDIDGYDVSTHGHGLLDLDKATEPVGVVGIPIDGRTNDLVQPVYTTYFATGTALPSSLANLKIMVLDDYERDYYMNLGSTFTVTDNRKTSDIEVMMDGNTYLPIQTMYGSWTQGGNYDLGYMNFGVFSGENGNGDFSANIGKHFNLTSNFKLKTSIGQMNEQDTWLGNFSNGALAVGDNNITNFGQLGFEYSLGNNILSFDYSKGFTDINTTNNSLITGFDNIETESMKLGYEIKHDDNNSYGFTASLPSHVTNGTMNLIVPESRTLDGQVNYTTLNSDMSSDTFEKDVGFYFKHTSKNDKDFSLKLSTEYRQDIAGQNGNDGVEFGIHFIKKINWNCQFFYLKNPKCFDNTGNLKANLYNYNETSDTATAMAFVNDSNTSYNTISSKSIDEKDTVLHKVKNSKITKWFKKKLWNL